MAMDDVRKAFDAIASHYDAQRKGIIPNFEDFYLAAAQAAEWHGKNPSILDIGSGTGLLSALLLEKFPAAILTLVDISPNMLAIARQRFSANDRVIYKAGDYRYEGLDRMYDLICSALSIHHLDHGEKRGLYARIYSALNPGGVFLNAEQVAGETLEQHGRYMEYWNDYVRHGPLPEVEWKNALERRDTLDKMEKLSVQLDWLRAIGFSDVDVRYKNRMLAVMRGRKR
jgi:tRNA (cmo5U34)-methyltransferase